MIACAAVGVVAVWPTSRHSAPVLVLAALVATALHGMHPARLALAATVPMVVFLAAALSLASLATRAGLAARAAEVLAGVARGRGLRLYAGVCGLTALLTLAVSLDGAVVLMAPVLLELRTRFRAPLAPYLLGAVAVANAVSAAVPQGNPTNIVLMQRLDLPAAAFLEHLFPASVGAAIAGAVAIAVLERRRLQAPVGVPPGAQVPIDGAGRRALVALALAAAGGAVASGFGITPAWPFAAVAAVALFSERKRATVPWRLAVQIAALLVVLEPLAAHVPQAAHVASAGLVGVLVAVSVFAALGNNLPAAAAVASLPLSGVGSLGAMLGLSVGALATPHGSVATLIASELTDPAGRVRLRWPLAVAASTGLVMAGVLAQLTLS